MCLCVCDNQTASKYIYMLQFPDRHSIPRIHSTVQHIKLIRRTTKSHKSAIIFYYKTKNIASIEQTNKPPPPSPLPSPTKKQPTNKNPPQLIQNKTTTKKVKKKSEVEKKLQVHRSISVILLVSKSQSPLQGKIIIFESVELKSLLVENDAGYLGGWEWR